MRALIVTCVLLLFTVPARADDPVTVLLDWFVNPDHAALVIAQERGLFAARGLEVELIAPADPNDPPKLVAAGKADLAVSYQPQVHLQAAAGLPLVRVGTLVDVPLNSLVVEADGPIETLADLEGRRVGYSVGGFEDALLGAMLREAGLSLDDVELINVNFALSPAIFSGRVDAVIGAFRNFELNQMEIEGRPGRAFYPEEHGVPPYDELVLIAHRDRADDPVIDGILAALEEATLWLLNHPEAGWETFVAAHPDLDDELNRRAWSDTLRRLAHSPGALDAPRWHDFAGFVVDSGLAEEMPPLDRYARDVR